MSFEDKLATILAKHLATLSVTEAECRLAAVEELLANELRR